MRHFKLLFLLLLLSSNIYSQQNTSVRGQVIEKSTGDPIPYASIQFENSQQGVTSDINGRYYLTTNLSVSKIKVSYIGFKTEIVSVNEGQANDINIALEEVTTDLNEIEVRVEKYRNKENPAVILIRNVIKNKDNNRNKSFDYFNYEKYEKVQLSYNNVTDATRKNFLFKSMKFVFDYVDTSKISGKVNLPFFLRESYSDVYYRNSPKSQKEYIRAEKNTLMPGIFDNVGIADFIQNLTQPIDIYDNAINLVTVNFVSPISVIAPNVYRFYIIDTSYINETKVAHLYFAPREKSDLAFIGHLWIALDSTFAVRKIELGIPQEINLNWVKELQLNQEFDWVEDNSVDSSGIKRKRGLMLTKDEIFMDFGLIRKEKTQSILGNKKIIYKNININKPLPDELFKTAVTTFRDLDAEEKPDSYWVEKRPEPLTKKDLGIIKMIDSLGKHVPFQRFVKVARLVLEGYSTVGIVNIGPVNTFYSFNQVEGFRGRFGGRTNTNLSQRFMAEGYAAYGFKDKIWKGFAGIRYSFVNRHVLRFPYNQIRIWYQNEIKIPGQSLDFVQEDNFLLSFKRGVNNKMIYNRVVSMRYLKESDNGFSYYINGEILRQRPGGVLLFDYVKNDITKFKKEINITEISINLRYAPNEKFYQTSEYRVPIHTKYPIFELLYSTGFKHLLGGEYNYHGLDFSFEKIFYLSPLGYSKVKLGGGRIFGQLPYPLLNIHSANQTYAYQFDSYNLMNFLEFVSDKYAYLHVFHNFGGFFFNRIPIMKYFKLREVMTCKVLYGGLDKMNTPDNENGLLKFPVDELGNTLSHSLEKQPYVEASVGIDNIFRFFRVDYVRRLTYLSNPHITRWGLRATFKVHF